jgi:hypothetical protein
MASEKRLKMQLFCDHSHQVTPSPRNYEAHARYIQRTFFKKEREEKKNKSIFRANASKMYMKARHRQGEWRKKAGVAKSIHLLRMWFCSEGSK